MRIWSLHPPNLDRMGLLACWRETLLAQAVLAERTRGYRNHPQLERFRAHPQPIAAVGAYLSAVAEEADNCGCRFDATRILRQGSLAADDAIPVTAGQLACEWAPAVRRPSRPAPARSVRRPSRPAPAPTVCRPSRPAPAPTVCRPSR